MARVDDGRLEPERARTPRRRPARPGGRASTGRLGVSTATRRWPSPCRCSSTIDDAGAVVEQHLADRRPGERVADRDDRQHLADLGPRLVGRVERRDHEPVDELVGELAREHALALGLAARVGDDHVQVVAAELAAQRLDEALLAEVLQRARQHADQPGAAARERARDRVAGVAQLLGGAADALLGLRRGLHAAQRVRDGRRGQPGRGGDVLDRDASPRGHAANRTGRGIAADRHVARRAAIGALRRVYVEPVQ